MSGVRLHAIPVTHSSPEYNRNVLAILIKRQEIAFNRRALDDWMWTYMVRSQRGQGIISVINTLGIGLRKKKPLSLFERLINQMFIKSMCLVNGPPDATASRKSIPNAKNKLWNIIKCTCDADLTYTIPSGRFEHR